MKRHVQRLWRALLFCSRSEHREALVMRPYFPLEQRAAGTIREPLWHDLLWRCVDCGAGVGFGHTMVRTVARYQKAPLRDA